jgi:uncharacterized membrane protein
VKYKQRQRKRAHKFVQTVQLASTGGALRCFVTLRDFATAAATVSFAFAQRTLCSLRATFHVATPAAYTEVISSAKSNSYTRLNECSYEDAHVHKST